MPLKGPRLKASQFLNIDSVTRFMESLQRPSGDIPWHTGGKTDPWDLVETIMGLNIGGRFDASLNAFNWLARCQNPDGSWFSAYLDGHPLDKTRETHMAAYFSVGLFHYWLITRQTDVVETFWPVMEKAVNYAVSLQARSGEIYWAKSPEGRTDPMSLLAGSSSIFMSLKCALALAAVLNRKQDQWQTAFDRLGQSIQENIHIYNVTKARFSMYWFYPVLSGALTGRRARARIQKHWNKYVVEGQGARCVSDQPWITIAETCELVLALAAMGDTEKARIVFSWIQDRVYDDYTYWCGYTFPDMVIWPEEKISWTNAVVLMAADALFHLTPASRLFSHRAWEGSVFTDLSN